MWLDEGVIRELHWHKEAEWAYGEWRPIPNQVSVLTRRV